MILTKIWKRHSLDFMFLNLNVFFFLQIFLPVDINYMFLRIFLDMFDVCERSRFCVNKEKHKFQSKFCKLLTLHVDKTYTQSMFVGMKWCVVHTCKVQNA